MKIWSSQYHSTPCCIADALYTKPRKADKSLQTDVDGDYDDVIPVHSFVQLESDSDSSSLYCNPYMNDNHKGVQVTAKVRKKRSSAPPVTRPKPDRFTQTKIITKPRPLPKKRILQLERSLSSGVDLSGDFSATESEFSETDFNRSCCQITDSDLDDYSGSEIGCSSPQMKSLASMSELSEMTMPDNDMHYQYHHSPLEQDLHPYHQSPLENEYAEYQDPLEAELGPGWDSQSGISI